MQDNEKRLWIDGHTHLDFHRDGGGESSFTLTDLLTVLDNSGEDLRLLCSLGGAEMHRAGTDSEAIHQANQALYEFLRPAEGRLFGCCFIHPEAAAQAHRDLDTYIGERGFVQVAEVEGILGFDLDSPEMISIVRHAAELGAPLEMHCSTANLETGEHMRQALNVARQVPEAKIIIGHAVGGRNTYQYILAAETYLAQGGDNLYLEIRDFTVRDYLRAANEQIGADRLVVGTDWIAQGDPPLKPYGTLFGLLFPERIDWEKMGPFGVSRWGNKVWLTEQVVLARDETPYPCNVPSLVGFLRESGVSEDDIVKIGSTNAIKLFGLEGRL